jgi:hypothetical protein
MSLAALLLGVSRYRAIQEIAKAGLEGDENLSRFFRYAKIRGEVLFFVFNHQVAKMEFGYKKESILKRLREHYKNNKKKMAEESIIFRRVEAIVVFEMKKEEPKREPERCKERAKGDFENRFRDEKLQKTLEAIRSIIKARHDNSTK